MTVFGLEHVTIDESEPGPSHRDKDVMRLHCRIKGTCKASWELPNLVNQWRRELYVRSAYSSWEEGQIWTSLLLLQHARIQKQISFGACAKKKDTQIEKSTHK